jgi:hypothetical protein
MAVKTMDVFFDVSLICLVERLDLYGVVQLVIRHIPGCAGDCPHDRVLKTLNGFPVTIYLCLCPRPVVRKSRWA